jgi:hypothetical protein
MLCSRIVVRNVNSFGLSKGFRHNYSFCKLLDKLKLFGIQKERLDERLSSFRCQLVSVGGILSEPQSVLSDFEKRPCVKYLSIVTWMQLCHSRNIFQLW